MNDVSKFMSPLYVLKKSHTLGHLPYPHYIRNNKDNEFLEVSPNNKKFFNLKRKC